MLGVTPSREIQGESINIENMWLKKGRASKKDQKVYKYEEREVEEYL
jgi:hypothetical protein